MEKIINTKEMAEAVVNELFNGKPRYTEIKAAQRAIDEYIKNKVQFNIWDSHNKQWLEPMAIFFGENNEIKMVQACKKGEDPLSDGWYKIEGKDLEKIAITGLINYNTKLLPY
jgi:hypothetical protein